MVKIRLNEDSLSLAVFEMLVDMADTETALEFFRRFQGQKLYFCTLETLQRRLLRKKILEEIRAGNLRWQQVADKYNVSIHYVDYNVRRRWKDEGVWQRSLSLYTTLVQMIGEDNANTMFDKFAGTGIVLCKLKVFLKDERDKKIKELHAMGVDKSEIASKFDLSYYHVSKIIKEAESRPGPQRRDKVGKNKTDSKKGNNKNSRKGKDR